MFIRCLIVLFAVSGAAHAEERQDRDHDRARKALRDNKVLPIAQILGMVPRHASGDIIRVKLETERDQLIYEIRVLAPSGSVREVILDARSGALIRIED